MQTLRSSISTKNTAAPTASLGAYGVEQAFRIGENCIQILPSLEDSSHIFYFQNIKIFFQDMKNFPLLVFQVGKNLQAPLLKLCQCFWKKILQDKKAVFVAVQTQGSAPSNCTRVSQLFPRTVQHKNTKGALESPWKVSNTTAH